MTIENRFEFFGLPIPGMRREMRPGMMGGLDYHSAVNSLLLISDCTILVKDEDTVVINLLSRGDTVTLEREQINQRKIRSKMIVPGLRSTYRWKPTK